VFELHGRQSTPGPLTCCDGPALWKIRGTEGATVGPSLYAPPISIRLASRSKVLNIVSVIESIYLKLDCNVDTLPQTTRRPIQGLTVAFISVCDVCRRCLILGDLWRVYRITTRQSARPWLRSKSLAVLVPTSSNSLHEPVGLYRITIIRWACSHPVVADRRTDLPLDARVSRFVAARRSVVVPCRSCSIV